MLIFRSFIVAKIPTIERTILKLLLAFMKFFSSNASMVCKSSSRSFDLYERFTKGRVKSMSSSFFVTLEANSYYIHIYRVFFTFKNTFCLTPSEI